MPLGKVLFKVNFQPCLYEFFLFLNLSTMNEYCEGKMSMAVVVDRICGWKLWTVDGSESVLRAWRHGRTFDFRVHGPSSRPILTFFYFSFFLVLLCNTI